MLRTLKYGLYAAVLSGLLAGGLAFVRVDKTVTVVVDGHPTRVHTTAATVGGVLAAAGYRAGAHDRLAPSAGAAVHSGSRIVLDRGRLLELDVDGSRRAVWTTGRTVEAALTRLGYAPDGYGALSPTEPLPPGVIDISVRPVAPATIAAGGLSRVTDAAVFVDGMPAGRATLAAAVVSATRPMLAGPMALEAAAAPGSARVLASPAAHPRRVSAKARTAGGSATSGSTAASASASGSPSPSSSGSAAGSAAGSASPGPAPSGTTSAPPAPSGSAAPSGSPQQIGRELVAARGWDGSQFGCLDSLWTRESHWNVHAQNSGSGAYGIPQALPGSKMSSAGPDWQNSAETQIRWGLGYIAGRYGTPCHAWSFWLSNGWY